MRCTPITVDFLVDGHWIRLTPAEYRALRKILTSQAGPDIQDDEMKDRGTNETESSAQRRA